MTARRVTTQEDLDSALADGSVTEILIDSPRGVWLTVTASGSATVRASGSATVEAYDSATVTAYGSATVRAYGSATVEAYDSATVRAYDSATVTASGSATVTASDSATVRAFGSATVEASGSATVTAFDSATVRAFGSATVRAYDSATVRASAYVAVHLFSARATVTGGVVIDVTALDLTQIRTWAAYHGAVADDEHLTVYKAVGDDWQTDRKGWVYEPGLTVEAADWDGLAECGGGLHLCATPSRSGRYYAAATRFVECLVDMSEAVVVGDKIKARSVRVVREVDLFGREVTR